METNNKSTDNISSGISDWQLAIDQLNISDKDGEPLDLTDDKTKSQAMLEKLNLPRGKVINTAVSDFLKNPELYFSQLTSPEYYVSITHPNENSRIRKPHLSHDEALEFIQNASGGGYDMLTIIETYPSVFGVNISVNKNGSVYAEGVRGTSSDLTTLNKIPDFSMELDEMTGLAHYSTEDPNIRKFLYDALSHIPADETHLSELGRDKKYHPGFYELMATYANEDAALKHDESQLKPIFIDYTDNEHYTIE